MGFLTFFLLTYAGMHALIYMRLRALWPDDRLIRLLVLLFFVIMIALPVAARVLDRQGLTGLGQVAAWVGYVWLGFVVLALTTTICSYVVEALLQGAVFAARGETLRRAPRYLALAVLFLSLVGVVYGFFEARAVRVERVNLVSDKLEAPLTIAQVTDMHLGPINGEAAVRRAFGLIKPEKPDIIAATGDIVEGRSAPVEALARAVAEVNPPLGALAVVGNHEVYAGLDKSVRILEQSGFTVLRNRAVILGGCVLAVGIDDPHAGSVDEAAILPPADRDRFTLLLKHQPLVPEATLGRFDLQLSGHTHGGQIFPFNFVTRAVYPMWKGLYRLKGGSYLYVSRGTLTWGPPIRVFAPPEVTIIKISPGSGGKE